MPHSGRLRSCQVTGQKGLPGGKHSSLFIKLVNYDRENYYNISPRKIVDKIQPNDTQPNDTQPKDTQPNDTQQNDTQRNDTQPNDTQSNDTQPNDTRL